MKLVINRIANSFLRFFFHIRLNDTTNAFKAYRREVIDGCQPLIAPHFNLTVEPLKAMSGLLLDDDPDQWRNQNRGSKLKLKEMGSRYLLSASSG
jgi:dolichol-phosphate mannosyltransferase